VCWQFNQQHSAVATNTQRDKEWSEGSSVSKKSHYLPLSVN
jgi:hypothetical protein